MPESQLHSQQQLIQAMLNPEVFPHPAKNPEMIETHISWVILAGSYAYKIKKAISLEFLDFSSIALRKFYCEEELRLNARLAPELYLTVVHICGTPEFPILEEAKSSTSNIPFEYAVKMSRFSQDGLLNTMLTEKRLTPDLIDEIARNMAQFHQNIPAAGPETSLGNADAVHQPVSENYIQIRRRIKDENTLQKLNAIQQWSNEQHQRLYKIFSSRKKNGFIRECHGDMHLGNMAMVKNKLTIFDGIEFNEAFRWIDVMSEVAFCHMDLHDHGRRDYSFRFLNGYLESTGDYEGLTVFTYYLVYRAMVRAKVASIRLQQENETGEPTGEALKEFNNYLQLALDYTRQQTPSLYITHGLSGSGKSSLTRPLTEKLPAIRIRSDRERQRLFESDKKHAKSGIEAGIYTKDVTRKTYIHLQQLAESILTAGYNVIVDATFLKREQRILFKELAERLNIPVHILHFEASEESLRQRIKSRVKAGTDISEVDLIILEHQLKNYTPPIDDELGYTINIDTDSFEDIDQIMDLI
ncbi:MAG: AAA family ATPase [Gammaproteobacteria bacterium]|nr:AAA family ATPase [Gammaproteobacteria bacterium]